MWAGLIIWHLALGALAGLAGQVSMLTRVEPEIAALEAQLQEREETAANSWALYEDAHCALKKAELTISQHLWEGATFWPHGDETGIPCATDAAGSPLFASAEEAPPDATPQDRTAEARHRSAEALVAAGPDAGR